MKFRTRLLAVILVLGPIAGCMGDNFGSLFHEMLAINNEMADNMVYVCDEETADYFLEKRLAKLTKRWGELRNRVETYLKRTDADSNPKVKFELAEMFVDYSDEYLGVVARISEQKKRLDQIRYKIYLNRYGHKAQYQVADLAKECPNITKVMHEASNAFPLKSFLPSLPFDRDSIQGFDPGMGMGMDMD